MAADVSLPKDFTLDHTTLVKIGIALTWSTPTYRRLTIFEAVDDLYARVRVNGTINPNITITEILGAEFQRTEQEVPIFQGLGAQPAYLVSSILKGHFDTLPHQDMDYMLMIPAIVLPILATIAVILRFFTRYFITKLVRWEDWLIIPGLVFAVALSISIGSAKGLGMHIWDVPFNDLLGTWKQTIIRQHFITFCHFFIKTSLLALYYRLSPKPSFQIAVMVTAVVNLLHTISTFFASLFACTPIIWSDALFTFKCHIDWVAVNFSGVIIFMILDVVIVLLPIPIIWRLQLQTREKLLTIGLFSLGFLVCIASGIKVARLHALVYDVDTTWQIENFQWVLIEVNLGVICACAPAFRHLTSKARLKRLYQERIQHKKIFHPHKPSNSLEQFELRKISAGNSEKTRSSLALRASHVHIPNRMPTDSKPESEGISHVKPAYLHPNSSCVRQNLKILSKDDLDLIEHGIRGIGTRDTIYSDAEGEGERESVYTHDLTRASSHALPDEFGDGFEIVKGSGVRIH
ncbi:hypothetical protein TWF694_009066 [Orbilia ellipsospora]|uniref:Rhodopsin domain-containing protein n=1 Tax=Orbilia ellipsospora TaxID=2528407 RepID=A0AAV9XF00_9PEZI